MNQFRKSLFTLKLSLIILTLFIIIIGIATFIENSYDTTTTKLLIYNASWFEFLLAILVIIYLINTIQKNNFKLNKFPQLIFHFSFIFILIGGGVSRNFGFEANMHLFENEVVDELHSLDPYLQLRSIDNNFEFTSPNPDYFSQLGSNSFYVETKGKDGNVLIISLKEYLVDAYDLFQKHGTEDDKSDYLKRNPDGKGPYALVFEILYGGKNHTTILFYDTTKYIQGFKSFKLDDLTLEMTYGPKPIKLPFSLQLNDFTLTKYPGTNIPSASESEVLLIDDRINLKEEHLIYKNHVLDYDGYRFFQTSYDDDENGTILSVNYDFYGTRITYFGYILMALGALLIMWSKNTHFSKLNEKIKSVQSKRKALLITILVFLSSSSICFTQTQFANPINEDHANEFGRILVQTFDGRLSPVHSLATDMIHKITGRDFITTAHKGKMDAMHLFLDIQVDPEYWRHQPLIIVRNQTLCDIIGISGKYASFNDLDNNGYYKLEELTYTAFQKNATEQSNLDRELIKVSERVYLFLNIINGTSLKIFPYPESTNNKWISWDDPLALNPLNNELKILNEDLQIPEVNYRNIMRTYLLSTVPARETNNYEKPNRIIGYINSIQYYYTPLDLLPSENKKTLEIFYNKSRIFTYLKYVYALLGIVLLTFTFIQNFKNSPPTWIRPIIKLGIGLMILSFFIQTIGMGLRWYIGGHAPWSNGYEVILLVAWATIIAGFSVMNFSKITLGATALITSVLLMVAGLSYYDPQLTNLNPVLKSYWLIIHVAIITIGYGFLALSFMLGLINIILGLVSSRQKEKLFSIVIEELTYINEKLLTIGVLLVAVGTYIGCVWANESWGTYWSWNAKQVWSLIIILSYGLILHFKYLPKMQSLLTFNIGSVISFGSVLMTFVGVNYYFTKGLHSYASDDPPAFPIYAWVTIIILFSIIISAIIKNVYLNKKNSTVP